MSDAAWHPDPLGRFELRYWDGSRWTEHVATGGVQQVDPEPLGYEDEAEQAAADADSTSGAATSASGDASAAARDAGAAAAVADDLAGTDLDLTGDAWAEVSGDVAPPEDTPPADTPAAAAPEVDPADQPTGSQEEVAASTVGAGDELPGAAVLGVPVQRDEPATDEGAGTAAVPPGAVTDLGAMPPPAHDGTVAGRPAAADLGEDGIGGGLLDDAAYEERSTDRVVLQNPRMLKVRLGRDVMIKRGSMVAYQGQMTFNYESEGGGVGGLLKRAVASDNSKMARVSGSGDLFLADDAFEIHMLELAGGGLVVNGPNLLAFEDGMTFTTRSLGNAGIVAGGVFVTDVSGHGWVAVTCHGTPVRLDTDVPTYVDVGSAVAWSSSLHVDLNVQKLSVKGMRSGEIAQLAFRGQGFVLVQASEGPSVPPSS